MISQLNELKKYITVAANTGDTESIRKFVPRDATTDPLLVLKATQLPQYQLLIADVIDKTCRQGGSTEIRLINAYDQMAVDIGSETPRHVPGYIPVEVDARSAWDCGMCVTKARRFIQLYEENGIGPEWTLTKLVATWEGTRAARELEQNGISYNLILLFSFAQVRTYTEADVSLISPFVGHIYDWCQKHRPQSVYQVDSDPGVASVRQIYQYYKFHDYDTMVMGASFRRIEQIRALADYDRLTIPPILLNKLTASEGVLVRQLTPGCVTETRPSPMTQAKLLWQHHQDPMVVEELAGGIRLFAVDQVRPGQQV